jgi:hypothetical protein
MNSFEITIGSLVIKATGVLGVLAALAAFALIAYLGT